MKKAVTTTVIQILPAFIRKRPITVRASDAPIDQANRFNKCGVGTLRSFQVSNEAKFPVGLNGVRPNKAVTIMSKSRKLDKYRTEADFGLTM